MNIAGRDAPLGKNASHRKAILPSLRLINFGFKVSDGDPG
jgi:hypothetical protein